jgi:hypothetical protein
MSSADDPAPGLGPECAVASSTWRAYGLSCAVVSSSANRQSVLAAGGIEDLSDQRIDGLMAERDHLMGKPAADRSWDGFTRN